MFRRMLIWRTITAADMTALGASAKMEPPSASRQAFNTTRTARHGQLVDAFSRSLHAASILVGARASHGVSSKFPAWVPRLNRRFANPRDAVFVHRGLGPIAGGIWRLPVRPQAREEGRTRCRREQRQTLPSSNQLWPVRCDLFSKIRNSTRCAGGRPSAPHRAP
jgi:hypothetical protein